MTYALRIHRHRQAQADREEARWREATQVRPPLDVEKRATHPPAATAGMKAPAPRREATEVSGLRVERFASPCGAPAATPTVQPMKKTAKSTGPAWSELFPDVPPERIARLTPEQRQALESGLLAVLAMLEKFERHPTPSPSKKE